MTRVPSRTPDELGGAFTTTQARAAGMTPRRLRHPSLAQPTRGLRLATPWLDVKEQAGALAEVLEGSWAFSHLTAARLLGLPLPRRWVASEAVHVMWAVSDNRARRPGVVGHRGLQSRPVGYAAGLPVVHPVQTWVDLASLRRPGERLSVEDLVVVADAVLCCWPDLGADLCAEVSARPGVRGIRAVRAALPHVRAGSASAMESRARLRLLAAGLPEPELNQDIVDDAGTWLGRVDMVWRRERVIVEYEGDQHRTDRLQWQRDIERVRNLEAAGWKVIRVSAEDLDDRARWARLVRVLAGLLGGGRG